ncbi:MAG TPA: protein-L-isoaspartate(D-aspartate) O-methyltransferase [Isosphaeraceae bacterium]|nr:protein-L-isoaspartate(D-aspartate) O-methyltransferase [Isosphaeraceae bacterium]
MSRPGELWPRRVFETVIGLGIAALFCALVFPGAWARGGKPTPGDQARFEAERQAMVTEQIAARGIKDPLVLDALRKVPRHRFVPAIVKESAYDDAALPIGNGQTISQPYIVALMTELLRPKKSMKVLEVGTGSGYQAAVLAACVGEVYTIETIPALGKKSEALLRELGCRNVHVRIGDGFDGWPLQAPFDAIIVTAAPAEVPRPLLEQLKVGGRLVAPVGKASQELVVITKTPQGQTTETVAAVQFVPMTGKAQHSK